MIPAQSHRHWEVLLEADLSLLSASAVVAAKQVPWGWKSRGFLSYLCVCVRGLLEGRYPLAPPLLRFDKQEPCLQ